MPTNEFGQASLVIELATPDDAETLYDIGRLTWLDTYPNAEAGITEDYIHLRLEGEHGSLISQKIKSLRESIGAADANQPIFIAKVAREPVGFVIPAVQDGKRAIMALYVLPGEQGKGTGGKLLQKALDWHGRNQDIFLRVASYNQPSIDFYKHHGFEATGRPVTDDSAIAQGITPIPEIEMVLKAKPTT